MSVGSLLDPVEREAVVGRLRRVTAATKPAWGQLDAPRTGAQPDRDLDAAVAQVLGVGVALAPIAIDHDLLALEVLEVRVLLVIDRRHAVGLLAEGAARLIPDQTTSLALRAARSAAKQSH